MRSGVLATFSLVVPALLARGEVSQTGVSGGNSNQN